MNERPTPLDERVGPEITASSESSEPSEASETSESLESREPPDPDAPATARLWLQACIPETLIDQYVLCNSDYAGDMTRREAREELRVMLHEVLAEKLRLLAAYLAKASDGKPALPERPRSARTSTTTRNPRGPQIPAGLPPGPTVTTELLARLRTNAPADLRLPAVNVTVHPPSGPAYDANLDLNDGKLTEV